MTPTMENLRRLCERTGATLVECDLLEVEAPLGHHFSGVGVHATCNGWKAAGGWAPTKRHAIAGAIDDIEGGFERCTTDSCPSKEEIDGVLVCGWDHKPLPKK